MFCPHCGNESAEEPLFCRRCGARIGSDAGLAGSRRATPWEDRAGAGLFNGLLVTVKEALFTPADFFRKMPVTGGMTDPLIYALVVGVVGLIFLNLWDILLLDSLERYMTEEVRSAAGGDMLQGLGTAASAVLMPFLLFLSLFILAGMLHLFLLMVGGARSGFEATFRVVSYGISPFLFMIIPFCGMLITMPWVMTLFIVGLKEAHETTGGKAAFAVFFPFLVCCGFIVVTAALFMGAIAAAFGAFMHF